MKAGLQILPAGPADAPEIIHLQKESYRSEAEIYQDFRIPPLLQTDRELQQEMAGGTLVLKALIGGKITGSVRAYSETETCFIGRLIVDPAFQNRGIGRQLMIFIENAFKNCRRFELFTGSESEKNLAFYRKSAYSEFKKEKINERLTLVFMEKFRSENPA